jgi:hypothetical protein
MYLRFCLLPFQSVSTDEPHVLRHNAPERAQDAGWDQEQDTDQNTQHEAFGEFRIAASRELTAGGA